MAYSISTTNSSRFSSRGASVFRRIAGFAAVFGLLVLIVGYVVHMWASGSPDRAGVDSIAQMVSRNAAVSSVVAVIVLFGVGVVRGLRRPPEVERTVE